jgi:ubiquinone/menaquinone biosynthesis C-methylase UbiE
VRPERELQRHYYARTARSYDLAHVQTHDEHYFALGFLVGVLEFVQAESVLEVGAGTGRALRYLRERAPRVLRLGIEPVPELRQVAYENGVPASELVDGDGSHLQFADGSFDVVCEFGVLHHVRDHARIVCEMLRVARKAIFISDSNNFGQGRPLVRWVKQALDAAGLWPLADFVKTRGKGHIVTEGDGVSYSYSVFNDYKLVRAHCRRIHVLNTRDGGVNPYRTAGHVALLGIK